MESLFLNFSQVYLITALRWYYFLFPFTDEYIKEQLGIWPQIINPGYDAIRCVFFLLFRFFFFFFTLCRNRRFALTHFLFGYCTNDDGRSSWNHLCWFGIASSSWKPVWWVFDRLPLSLPSHLHPRLMLCSKCTEENSVNLPAKVETPATFLSFPT